MAIQKLSELFEQGYEIKSKFATTIATQLREGMNDPLAKIRNDQHLTAHGKRAKEAELKQEAAREVFGVVAKEKATYAKVAAEATALAKKMKTDANKPPSSAVDVKLFEQELAALQTSIMLSTNVDTAIKAIDTFQSKYDEPYYAAELQKAFPSFIQTVTAIDDSPKHKQALTRVYSSVQAKATTPEVAKANEVLAYFSDSENIKLFRDGSPQHNTVKTYIGSIANHINEPETALGILNGEVETFAGIAGTNVME
ncbi:hypothetical protein [Lysinibacillus sphaericus]|uniref:hypothetical protein n=1 Tax=Lysinibacillus sphaericus TaxID=1421 RepID=UPI001A9F2174|nr:hypothetical protein [Lysinibacillus sphaericus]QTB25555.1 hypothetical protein J2D51_14635 [Lysinibacillus sphaericus]